VRIVGDNGGTKTIYNGFAIRIGNDSTDYNRFQNDDGSTDYNRSSSAADNCGSVRGLV
jgi:hypothetical protein